MNKVLKKWLSEINVISSAGIHNYDLLFTIVMAIDAVQQSLLQGFTIMIFYLLL